MRKDSLVIEVSRGELTSESTLYDWLYTTSEIPTCVILTLHVRQGHLQKKVRCDMQPSKRHARVAIENRALAYPLPTSLKKRIFLCMNAQARREADAGVLTPVASRTCRH